MNHFMALPIEKNVFMISRGQHSSQTGFEEQHMSDTALKRFRKRCLTYETEHGVDLIKECVTELSGEMAKLMKISGQIRPMDSLMLASNIKQLSRLENAASEMRRSI